MHPGSAPTIQHAALSSRTHLQQRHARPRGRQAAPQSVVARIQVLQRAQAPVGRRQRAVQVVVADVEGVEELEGRPRRGQVAADAVVVQVAACMHVWVACVCLLAGGAVFRLVVVQDLKHYMQPTCSSNHDPAAARMQGMWRAARMRRLTCSAGCPGSPSQPPACPPARAR